MEYYYIITDFYPNINNADDFEEALIPYHTFEEACDAIEATMDIYDNHNVYKEYKGYVAKRLISDNQVKVTSRSSASRIVNEQGKTQEERFLTQITQHALQYSCVIESSILLHPNT